mmetsp:Transcript_27784/g.82939  ORF Transcript_27784/g.82939 Transcript_27784/m.82939 type:complete len:346 (+) Transcript_27784:76-1113(+)
MSSARPSLRIWRYVLIAGWFTQGTVGDVPSLPLLGGGSIPMSGLGLCCRPTAKGEAVRQSVFDFLMMGGRHLDGAHVYKNAKEVGQGIRDAMARGVPRKEIFYTTKVPATMYGFGYVAEAIPQMLKETDIGYFDLVLLHAPTSPKLEETKRCQTPWRCRQETWLALERFKHSGLIKHLGVSNFSPERMEGLLALGGSPIAVNQIEYHPWVPELHHKTVEWCHQRGIVVTAFASLGSPNFRGQQRQLGTFSQGPFMEQLTAIAASHGKTWTQVLLRWAIQHNVSVIPGTGNPRHMAENLDVFEWNLKAEDMSYLDSVPGGQRGVAYSFFLNSEFGLGNRDAGPVKY